MAIPFQGGSASNPKRRRGGHLLGRIGIRTRSAREDTTVRGIARIIAEAEAVIAPHGAGFSNIVFTSPGTRVLELIGARYTPQYWMIVNELNLKNFAFEADVTDGKKLDPEVAMNCPIPTAKAWA